MSEAYRDGGEALRARLDDLAWQRDVLIDKRLDDQRELARLQREIAAVEKSLCLVARIERRRWRWLVAVPVGAVGLFLVGAFVHSPSFTRPKIDTALVGAGAVRQAAELYVNVEDATSCPTVEDLIAAKKLDAKKVDDPWGRPYHIACTGDEVRAVSAGKDGRFFTADDVRDDFKPSDMMRLSAF